LSSKLAFKEHPASFRDPAGFLFYHQDKLYRRIDPSYRDHYDHLMNSGLYNELAGKSLLIRHEDVTENIPAIHDSYRILMPERVPFISYPYEWSFSQLKDAALLTLEIQRLSLRHGMSLKDCSAYNVQFVNGRPIFIDTLSFEILEEGSPWVAYRQFCQHFLAPLALMKYSSLQMNRLLRSHLDGIPLALAKELLPYRTLFNLPLLFHIHAHAKCEQYYSDKKVDIHGKKFNRRSLYGLIDSLENAVRRLRVNVKSSEWSNYYNDSSYSEATFEQKKAVVSNYLDCVSAETAWDMGANIGLFSRIASEKGLKAIAFDVDPLCVEQNYLNCRRDQTERILPLLMDLSNPSPGIGWAHEERLSLLQRGPADVVLSLALIHHLAFTYNLPMRKIAHFFGEISRKALIIEFVPAADAQAQRLIRGRGELSKNYTRAIFENEFSKYFQIIRREKLINTERYLYLMAEKLDNV